MYSRINLSEMFGGSVPSVGTIYFCPQSPSGEACILRVVPYSIGEFGSEETVPTHVEIWWTY